MKSAAGTMEQKGKSGPSTDPDRAGPKRGRPKGGGRIKSKYTIVHTTEYMAWMAEFMAHAGEKEVSDTFREGVKRYAKDIGFRLPPKR